MSGPTPRRAHARASHPAAVGGGGVAPVRLFCADLDGTLIGNLEATRRFKLLWESIPAHRRPVLCYSSGRLIDDALDVIEEMPLPRCDYIIGGVGTQIYRAADEALLDEYDLLLDEGWSHEAAERVLASVMGIERQP